VTVPWAASASTDPSGASSTEVINPRDPYPKNKQTSTLSKAVALHITIIILASPHVSTFRFDHIGNHIVNESMLIPEFLFFELFLVGFFVDSLEGILESAVVFFHDGIFGSQIERVLSLEGEFEATVGESFDTFVSVVHSHTNSSLSGEVVDLELLNSAVISSEGHFELSRFGDNKVSGSVLVTVSVSADDDRFLPAGDEPGDVIDDDWLSEDSTIQDVSDGSIGTLPHLLEFELLNSGLVRSNGGTFDADLAFFDGLSSLNGDFVISLISVLHAEVEVLDLEIEERKNKLIPDGLPDDSGHLITVELSNWVVYLDLSTLHKI
jgi:hypothetical protein